MKKSPVANNSDEKDSAHAENPEPTIGVRSGIPETVFSGDPFDFPCAPFFVDHNGSALTWILIHHRWFSYMDLDPLTRTFHFFSNLPQSILEKLNGVAHIFDADDPYLAVQNFVLSITDPTLDRDILLSLRQTPTVQVLSNSQEDGPTHSILSCTHVPVIEEISVEPDSDDDDEDICKPEDFKNQEALVNLNVNCESEGNVLNESQIYIHTGTDELKKVRILDFSNCSFTSIMPIDINYCYNLVELNLYNNSISYLPRCLFLPNLMKLSLRRNRFLTVSDPQCWHPEDPRFIPPRGSDFATGG